MPEKAEANVNVIELLLLYIISPITTFSELSTTVTDGNFSIVCVIFHVVAAEAWLKIVVDALKVALLCIYPNNEFKE